MINQENLNNIAKPLLELLSKELAQLKDLTDSQIYALLAYKLWADGMDWDQGIPEIAKGTSPLYNSREAAIKVLVDNFGYSKE